MWKRRFCTATFTTRSPDALVPCSSVKSPFSVSPAIARATAVPLRRRKRFAGFVVSTAPVRAPVTTTPGTLTATLPENVPAIPAVVIGIAILGQTLTGDLSFTERATDVQLTVANGRLDLGDGLVSVSNAAASFTITTAGIAGTFSGSVAINVPGVVVTGALTGAVDTTNPANRFLRLSGTAVALAIAGETLNGDFTLGQGTSASGERVVKVAVQNLRFHIGSGIP